MSGNPGPASWLSIWSPARKPVSAVAEIRPSRAYLSKFVANSDAASVTCSALMRSKPTASASCRISRRARSTSACEAIATSMVSGTLAPPLPDGYRGPSIGGRFDDEVVHEPSGPRKSHAQSRPTRESVFERERDIRNTGAVVVHDHLDTRTAVLPECSDGGVALSVGRISNHVAGQLGHGGSDPTLVDQAEAVFSGDGSGQLTRGYDPFFSANDDTFLISHHGCRSARTSLRSPTDGAIR